MSEATADLQPLVIAAINATGPAKSKKSKTAMRSHSSKRPKRTGSVGSARTPDSSTH